MHRQAPLVSSFFVVLGTGMTLDGEVGIDRDDCGTSRTLEEEILKTVI